MAPFVQNVTRSLRDRVLAATAFLNKNVRAADLARAKRGGDYFASWRGSRITPWCEPSTAATYALATSAEARPEVGSMPNFTIVSFTQGGLTALMRKFRGISSAAARTKPSRPALTIETDQRDFGACYWRVWACLRNEWFRWHAHKLHPGVERTSRYSSNRQLCLISYLDAGCHILEVSDNQGMTKRQWRVRDAQ
jgi:hypothetical protein